jgi:hypothetical protein
MFGSSIYFATKVSVVVSFIFFILGWLIWNPEALFYEGSPLGSSFFVYSYFAVNIFFISFYLKFFKSEKRGALWWSGYNLELYNFIFSVHLRENIKSISLYLWTR